jgi:general secretion pathway protein K
MWTISARRGSALLAVLWLSAALAAIAFSLASTVRGETERAATAVDALRSHYLAAGALRRAILHLDWARQHPDVPELQPIGAFYHFDFPAGQATVEIIPETSKLNINTARPDDLVRLLINLGVEPGRAQDLVAAIVARRSPPHQPFQEIEELLAIPGITPDLFYGTWERAPDGAAQRFYPRTGLADCVSIFGATDRFDVNTAPPAVLAAVGVPPETITAIVEQRRVRAFLNDSEIRAFASPHLRVGGNSIFTFRATARLRLPNGGLSDMRRTVAAQVKLMPPGYAASYNILRWYDNAAAPQW